MTKASRKQAPELILPVVADGALAMQTVANGFVVPVLMLDTSGHAQVAELIRVHEYFPSGDVDSQWASPVGHDDVLLLNLEFKRPLELTLGVAFDLTTQARLVDQILRVRCTYLQHGEQGGRMSTTFDNPRILVELPPTGFEPQWEKIYFGAVNRGLRRSGLTRKQAKQAAGELIGEWRRLGPPR